MLVNNYFPWICDFFESFIESNLSQMILNPNVKSHLCSSVIEKESMNEIFFFPAEINIALI